jgi:hypothetical protein
MRNTALEQLPHSAEWFGDPLDRRGLEDLLAAPLQAATSSLRTSRHLGGSALLSRFGIGEIVGAELD